MTSAIDAARDAKEISRKPNVMTGVLDTYKELTSYLTTRINPKPDFFENMAVLLVNIMDITPAKYIAMRKGLFGDREFGPALMVHIKASLELHGCCPNYEQASKRYLTSNCLYDKATIESNINNANYNHEQEDKLKEKILVVVAALLQFWKVVDPYNFELATEDQS